MSDKPYPKPVKLITKKKLFVSWQASKDSKGAGGAPGIDGITPGTFRKSLEEHLLRIADLAKSGEFKFHRLRASPISKGDGRHRIICVPTVRDRLVQRVILHYLITDKRDLLGIKNENSFGASKGPEQGTHAAIQTAINRRQKKPYVLKTDISKFFDNVPREYLLKQIKTCLGHRSVVPLLEQVIHCEIRQKSIQQGDLIKQSGIVFGKGLRQGMPLSPLLSNLVLSKFDQKLAKLGKSFIRYVDDLGRILING
jgi:RNA-directed DNA polymerase